MDDVRRKLLELSMVAGGLSDEGATGSGQGALRDKARVDLHVHFTSHADLEVVENDDRDPGP